MYIRTLIDAISRVLGTRANIDRARGYDDVASVANISPLSIITDDLKNYEGTEVVASTILNLTTSSYLQALPLSNDIGGGEAVEVLRRLQPDPRWNIDNRKVIKGGVKVAASMLSEEAYTNQPSEDFLGFGNECLGIKNVRESSLEMDVTDLLEPKSNVKGIDSNNKVNDVSVLEKQTSVTIKTSTGDVKVPLTMTLNVHYVTKLVASEMLSGVTIRDTFTEQYNDWRAGVISHADFFFARERIARKRKALIQDKTGILKEIQNRREAGWAVVASDGFHLGECTNCAIISTDTLRTVESRHAGKISSTRVREAIFNDLSLMVLAIVDKEDDIVTFYYRNKALSDTKKISYLKRLDRKAGGPDIVEVLGSLNSNKSLF